MQDLKLEDKEGNIEEKKEENKEEKKEENKEENIEENNVENNEEKKEDEVGPIMGLFAVSPKIECIHCIPDEHILDIEEFKDVKITDSCNNCDHKKENWICIKCK